MTPLEANNHLFKPTEVELMLRQALSGSFGTYRNTGRRPLVTQTEAAVKVHVAVLVLDQEQQG